MTFHEQTILTKYHAMLMKCHPLFFSKNKKDVAKIVVCCSRDWRFKTGTVCIYIFSGLAYYGSIVLIVLPTMPAICEPSVSMPASEDGQLPHVNKE